MIGKKKTTAAKNRVSRLGPVKTPRMDAAKPSRLLAVKTPGLDTTKPSRTKPSRLGAVKPVGTAATAKIKKSSMGWVKAPKIPKAKKIAKKVAKKRPRLG